MIEIKNIFTNFNDFNQSLLEAFNFNDKIMKGFIG